jgi:signal transduction histidine kinase/GAF domain-containing protein
MSKRSSQDNTIQILSQLCDVPFKFESRDRALKQIARLGRELLRSHTCSVVLVDLDRSVLTQMACASSNAELEQLLQNQVVHVGSGHAADWIDLERLKPGVVEKIHNLDVDGQGVANPTIAREYGLISMLSHPLMFEGQEIGRFNSFTTSRNSFGNKQEYLIQLLARFTVITLEKFDYSQSRARTLTLVSQLSDRLLTTRHQEFLQAITDRACQLLSVPVCIFWRLDRETRKLRVVAASANVDQKFRQLEMSIDEPGITHRLSEDISNIFNVNDHQDIVNAKEIKERGWVSLLCASLRVPAGPLGVLDVFTTEERQFTNWESESFRTFAQHAALSLRIADLIDKAEGREKLEMLLQATMNMSQQQNTRDLLKVFLDGALHLVKAKNGLIRQLDYSTGNTKVVADSKDPPPKLIELKFGDGITGLALKEERPIRVADLREPKWQARHVQAWDKEMRSELAVPIILRNATVLVGRSATTQSGSKPIGVLNIESEVPDFFTDFDENCLASLSQYAALMIDRLKTEEKSSKIERFEGEIKESPNYDDTILMLMRGITETLEYEYANISMVEPELDCIRSKHVVGIAKDQIERFKNLAIHQLNSPAIEAEVIKNGQTVVPGPEDKPISDNDKVINEFHLDLLSRVYVPIIEPSRNAIIGTLEAGYKKEFRPYIYEGDVRNLKRLVGYAAQALHSQRSGILATLSHELRTPIIGIRNNTSFLQRRFTELDSHKIQAKFSDILADCQMLLYQAAELEYGLGIRSRTKSKLEPTLVYKDIIIKTINQLKEVVASRNLDPKKMDPRRRDAGRILITTDRGKLNQVVYNLLINAIKYAEKDPKQFTVRVEVDESRDSFIIKFKDWGIGIKKEYAHKVFDEGFRTPEAQAADIGTGLGLTLSKAIMNDLGGDLKLVGFAKPTEFHLILPKQQRSAAQ